MNGDYKEFSIYWIQGEKRATISCPSQSSMGKKLIKLSESKPEDVTVDIINEDGTLVAHTPVKYIKLNAPRVYSEEQREAFKERMLKVRDSKSN